MSASQSLIHDLEEAIANRDIRHRAVALRRVADLFTSMSGDLSQEKVALFDDVMQQLVDQIEISARASFGEYLAQMSCAPPRLLRRLALDDAIDVARPVLARSERLDETILMEGARSKSQAHLLAISTRKTVPESVTDILIARGSREVVLSAVGNPGALFSDASYSNLVRRSTGDDDLADCAWSRLDIPRQHLLKLFAEASESLKQRLTRKDPHKAALILEIVTRAESQLQARTRETFSDFAAAQALVRSLKDAGRLDEAALAEFARLGKFDETASGLALICEVPIGLAERALVDDRPERIVVLARSADFSWMTAKAILSLHAGPDKSPRDRYRLFEAFTRLKPDTARKAVQFYRLRERSVTPQPH